MTYRRQDTYYRRAKASGYRARSAYKLAELDARFRLLRPGDVVADLGAWPGGWAQVALERVGSTGRVVGVDAIAVEPLDASNVVLIQGDVLDPATIARVTAELGRPADVVLCDLAPKLSGIRSRDEARCAALVEAALGALPTLLRSGGRLLIKLFMNADYPSTVAALRARFATVRATRPESTRHGSAELYAVGIDYRGG